MANKFVHVAKKATFLAITDYETKYNDSIVFIKDTQEIWTHGTFYAIPDSYKTKITTLESAVTALKAVTGFSKVSDGTNTAAATGAEATLTIKGASGIKTTVSAAGVQVEHTHTITAGKAGSETTKTAAFGGTVKIPQIEFDGNGHVTKASEVTVTLPANPNTDTKVTSAANHYAPTADSASALDATATDAAAWGDAIVTGVQRDAKGHVVGLVAKKLPSNPNTDTKVTSADNHYTPVAETYTPTAGTTALAYGAHVITGITKDSKGHIVGVSTSPLMAAPDKALIGLGKVENKNVSEILASDAVTQDAGTNNTKIATTAFVQAAVNKVSQAVAGGLIYRGTLGTSGTVTALPASHKVGDVYIVKTAGTFAGQTCEPGDMIICNTEGTAAADAHWNVVQTNINGAVTATSDLTANQLVVGAGSKTAKPLAAGTNGQILKMVGGVPTWEDETDTNTTYTFTNGTAGSFTVTPKGGNVQTVTIGKPATAGAADTAAKLATGRSIALTGAVTGTTNVKFDGSGDVSIATTLANIASNKVTAMTGYTKAAAPSAIAATDSLNTAIGKLEAGFDWEEI